MIRNFFQLSFAMTKSVTSGYKRSHAATEGTHAATEGTQEAQIEIHVTCYFSKEHFILGNEVQCVSK